MEETRGTLDTLRNMRSELSLRLHAIDCAIRLIEAAQEPNAPKSPAEELHAAAMQMAAAASRSGGILLEA